MKNIIEGIANADENACVIIDGLGYALLEQNGYLVPPNARDDYNARRRLQRQMKRKNQSLIQNYNDSNVGEVYFWFTLEEETQDGQTVEIAKSKVVKFKFREIKQ